MVLVDVSPVVESLSSQTVTRMRRSAPTVSAAGHLVAGTTSSASLSCVLQRPSSDALQRLPEGLRAQARWLLHTTGDIRGGSETTAGGGTATLPDLVTYDGRQYVVVDITDQSAHGAYRRCILLDGGG